MEDLAEDPRVDELCSLEAIFPEIQRFEDDGFSFRLELPISPAKPVTVMFPAASETIPVPAVAGASTPAPSATTNGVHAATDSHELAYLPSIAIDISLPKGYPAEKPPIVTLSTSPPWVPRATLERLEADAHRLWEDMGRDLVAFVVIDHVSQAAESVFGMVGRDGVLEVDPAYKIIILDHDIHARRAAFEMETFDCGICLTPKKGSACHKMVDCGHVFCTVCLQEFYNDAIQGGDLTTVRCLSPNCAKERTTKTTKEGGAKRRKPKTFINPSELLEIGLTQETVSRYVSLRYKVVLEADKNTIYCPRTWCNGAARSKKHKKPEGLELHEAEDEDEESGAEDENNDANKKAPKPYNPADLLAICEDCSFAFCSRCGQSWHGEFQRCNIKRDEVELTAEEEASLEYLKLHTTPCPTCAAPAQKTYGCNHMICFRCQTHFCYLCSAWLSPENPYSHFNQPPSRDGGNSCYMRLFELEGGDGDDVGQGFAGGVRNAEDVADELAEQAAIEIINMVPEIEEPDDEEPVRNNHNHNHQNRNANAQARRGRGGRNNNVINEPNAAHNRPAENQPEIQVEPDFGLGEHGEEWVRRFVQLALVDMEDSSDEEGA